MTLPVYHCHYCGTEVDPFSRFTWQRVAGWERKAGVRASGKHGGSDITLREPIEGLACAVCIDKLKRGVSTGQEMLL